MPKKGEMPMPYLPEKRVFSMLSLKRGRQAKLIKEFASCKYLGSYQFEINIPHLLPQMAIYDLYKVLYALLYLPSKHIQPAYDFDIARFRYLAAKMELPLLIFFSKACEIVTDDYLFAPTDNASSWELENYDWDLEKDQIMLENHIKIETELARLISIFFHSLGINPFKYQLKLLFYDYRDDFLRQYLSAQTAGVLKI